jgi:uncharacterized protein YoxC
VDYKKHVEWFFFALISGAASLSVSHLGKVSSAMAEMTESVSELNAKMQVIISELSFSQRQISDHEMRIRKFESK